MYVAYLSVLKSPAQVAIRCGLCSRNVCDKLPTRAVKANRYDQFCTCGTDHLVWAAHKMAALFSQALSVARSIFHSLSLTPSTSRYHKWTFQTLRNLLRHNVWLTGREKFTADSQLLGCNSVFCCMHHQFNFNGAHHAVSQNCT
jgi:hypothetical protein